MTTLFQIPTNHPLQMPDTEAAFFTVRAKNMLPTLKPGWKVRAHEVPPAQWPTINNTVICVETNEGFSPIIMRLKENQLLETALLHLHPDNRNHYKWNVPLHAIRRIWQVTHIVDGLIV
ncbi:hypothetical protein [Larkinella rosea]|uniref:Peptidase S24/S26A/S26B/S26C domain-containing protein n=1 Tax=Larkinella rosea TaxID=2025312 RepID=A0A3P1BZ19_9BACT|nr:hypothetical protein [Larkinella rosea]RRB06297.1 hypothetical protein EHT25_00380 [Larkinella rosea]